MEQTPAQKVIARCKDMVVKAQELYGLDLSKVPVSFDLRGRCAGKAQWMVSRLTRATSAHRIKFNRDMLTREAFDHVYNDTIPHEYAHIICALNPTLGSNHDYGWARVCRAMGGSGARTHDEDVVYGNGITYEYITCRGNKVRLSERKHRAVQAGTTLRYRRGLGTVSAICAYSIVGHKGRTLAAPIVKQAANVPALIEEAMHQARNVAPATQLHIEALLRGPAPVRSVVPAVQAGGQSKAAVSRSIMQAGYRAGHSYEAIINSMMLANGYPRQLARATFKANAARVNIPGTFA